MCRAILVYKVTWPAVQQEAVGLGRERREGRTMVVMALAVVLAVVVAVVAVVAIVVDAALLQLAVRFGTLA